MATTIPVGAHCCLASREQSTGSESRKKLWFSAQRLAQAFLRLKAASIIRSRISLPGIGQTRRRSVDHKSSRKTNWTTCVRSTSSLEVDEFFQHVDVCWLCLEERRSSLLCHYLKERLAIYHTVSYLNGIRYHSIVWSYFVFSGVCVLCISDNLGYVLQVRTWSRSSVLMKTIIFL